MFEKILVCLDGSKLAEQILPYATEEALRFNSAMILLQVVNVPEDISMVSAAGMTAQSGDIIKEEIEREEAGEKAYLDDVAKPLLEKGVKVETATLWPSPIAEAIMNYAHENGIGLICISTHGYSGLGRVVFGSIAEEILKKSGLPILLIRPKEVEK